METRKEIEKKFYSIMVPIYNKENLKTVDPKYHNLKTMFIRFYGKLCNIKQDGGMKGLDFGCGCAAASVIGKLIGLDITGLDVTVNRYLKIQAILRNLGHSITTRNTDVFPWDEFKDNEFDFVCSHWGITMQLLGEVNPLNSTGERQPCFDERYKELIRITKPNGVWYVTPERNIEVVQKAFAVIKDTKSIRLELWNQ